MKIKNKLCGLAAATLMLAATAGSASAASGTCNVTNVAWSTGDGGTLQIFCDGVGYWGFGTHNTCSTANSTARDKWFKLALAAQLSGKPLQIGFDYCGGRTLTYVQIKN